MNWLLENWAWVLGGLGVLLVFAALFNRLRPGGPRSAMAEQLDTDAKDPLRCWCQAAMMLVTRDCDYGHLDRGEARRMLQRWWHIHGPRELHDVLDELAHSPHPDNAWELLRFVLVARLGAAAGMVDPEQSWEMIAPVAKRLQRAYDDWPDMAQAYVVARRQWRELPLDGSNDDATMQWITHNLHALRSGLWTERPFALDLENA